MLIFGFINYEKIIAKLEIFNKQNELLKIKNAEKARQVLKYWKSSSIKKNYISYFVKWFWRKTLRCNRKGIGLRLSDA